MCLGGTRIFSNVGAGYILLGIFITLARHEDNQSYALESTEFTACLIQSA